MLIISNLRYRLPKSIRRTQQCPFQALPNCRLFSDRRINQYPYSTEEQQKILQKLNESDIEELSRLNISPGRLAKLDYHRQQGGTFSSLDDVTKACGFDRGPMERLCNSILSSASEKKLGNRIKFVKPHLSNSARDKLKTVVGIHVQPNVVSWTKVDREGNVVAWEMQKLDLKSRMQHPLEILDTAMVIMKKLPDSDVYVMEEFGNSTQLSKNMLSFLLPIQLRAMILAFLTAAPLNTNEGGSLQQAPSVFFLRHQIPARLFRIIVGSERVSAQPVINEILMQEPPSSDLHYTPVVVSTSLRDIYYDHNNTEKEIMCQPLLLTMAFMDIAVHLNERSISALMFKKMTM